MFVEFPLELEIDPVYAIHRSIEEVKLKGLFHSLKRYTRGTRAS